MIRTEHPTIGSVELFGQTIWLGWLMLAALAYSVILPVVFGRLKMGPARELHDKVLWADALMNKADWLAGLAAAVGVVGIGFGLWWADAAAALVIAADVLHDGYHHTTAAVRDLMDETPRSVDDKELDPLTSRMQAYVEGLPWVRASRSGCARKAASSRERSMPSPACPRLIRAGSPRRSGGCASFTGAWTMSRSCRCRKSRTRLPPNGPIGPRDAAPAA
ncbi:MAG TPA: cation transporter [Mesorhizobium sp.]|nr:cation transporter [Mesorhizobium sp.]